MVWGASVDPGGGDEDEGRGLHRLLFWRLRTGVAGRSTGAGAATRPARARWWTARWRWGVARALTAATKERKRTRDLVKDMTEMEMGKGRVLIERAKESDARGRGSTRLHEFRSFYLFRIHSSVVLCLPSQRASLPPQFSRRNKIHTFLFIYITPRRSPSPRTFSPGLCSTYPPCFLRRRLFAPAAIGFQADWVLLES